MNNLHNVNFKTDLGLYDKFRLINTIIKEKHQDVLTRLIEGYVTKNERFLENPEIQEVIQPALPEFYGKQVDWARYVRKLDKKEFENMATRVTFFRFLLHDYTINHADDVYLNIALKQIPFFQKSDDYKFLSHGIFSAVQQMKRVL